MIQKIWNIACAIFIILFGLFYMIVSIIAHCDYDAFVNKCKELWGINVKIDTILGMIFGVLLLCLGIGLLLKALRDHEPPKTEVIYAKDKHINKNNIDKKTLKNPYDVETDDNSNHLFVNKMMSLSWPLRNVAIIINGILFILVSFTLPTGFNYFAIGVGVLEIILAIVQMIKNR